MGFPIPGNAIEQSLDLNRRLLKHSASTFVMQVEPTMAGSSYVCAGDLLIVDRARTPQARTLVVAIVDSELIVMRFEPTETPVEVWGVVSALIRENP
ncbi:MAG: S24 family peptidase [Cyanobacteria bacterium P01_D01_bin.105]